MDQNSDIDAWRQVHRQLTLALIQSRDNIAAELTKRRYILEEMNRCKMQNTQSKYAPGSSSSSKAKKKAAPKKAVPKKEKSPVVAGKVKKMPPSTMSADATKSVPHKANTSKTKVKPKLGGHKNDGLATESMMASIVAPPPNIGIGGEGPSDDKGKLSKMGDSDGSEVLHSNEVLHPNPQFAGMTPHQVNQMYH